MAALSFAATAGGAGGDSPSPNLLVNGDFSRGVLKRPWNELHPGSQAIPGWRVLRNVDYVPAEYWQASGGTASVDLDGSPGPGELAQDFATVPGRTYRVAFDLAANADGPPRVKTLLVSVAGTTHRFAFDQTGHSNRSMGYVRESFDFTAPGTPATLDFASLSRAGNWNGPVIAEVSVVDLSPPQAAEAAVATPLRAPSPVVRNAPQTPAPETRAPETRAPVVALAPRPHRISARAPVVPLAGCGAATSAARPSGFSYASRPGSRSPRWSIPTHRSGSRNWHGTGRSQTGASWPCRSANERPIPGC